MLQGKRFKIITAIAMFYDLESPMDFMREIAEVLATDGVWVLELSYLPTMLEATAYDTVCHEHLEYYALRQIRWMAQRVGLKILDVTLNDVNGGSFAVTLARAESKFRENTAKVASMIAREYRAGLSRIATYRRFEKKVYSHRKILLAFLRRARRR